MNIDIACKRIYLSPSLFQSLSLIISITANNSLINNNRKN